MRSLSIILLLLVMSLTKISSQSRHDSARFFYAAPQYQYYTPDSVVWYNDTIAVIRFGETEQHMCDSISQFTFKLYSSTGVMQWQTSGLRTVDSLVRKNNCDLQKQTFTIHKLDTFSESKYAIETKVELLSGEEVTRVDTLYLKSDNEFKHSLETRSRSDLINQGIAIDGVNRVLLGKTLNHHDTLALDSIDYYDFWHRWDFALRDNDSLDTATDPLQRLAQENDKFVLEEWSKTDSLGYIWYGDTEQGTDWENLRDNIIPRFIEGAKRHKQTIAAFLSDEPNMHPYFDIELGTSGVTHLQNHQEAADFYENRFPLVMGNTESADDVPDYYDHRVSGTGAVFYDIRHAWHPYKLLGMWRVIFNNAKKYLKPVVFSLHRTPGLDVTQLALPFTEKEWINSVMMVLFEGTGVDLVSLYTGVTRFTRADHQLGEIYIKNIENRINSLESLLAQDVKVNQVLHNVTMSPSNTVVPWRVGVQNSQDSVFLGYTNCTNSELVVKILPDWLKSDAEVEPWFQEDNYDVLSFSNDTIIDTLGPIETRYIRILSDGIFEKEPTFEWWIYRDESLLESFVDLSYDSIGDWTNTGTGGSARLSIDNTDKVAGTGALKIDRIGVANSSFVQNELETINLNRNKMYVFQGWEKAVIDTLPTTTTFSYNTTFEYDDGKTLRENDASSLGIRGTSSWHRTEGHTSNYDTTRSIHFRSIFDEATSGSYRLFDDAFLLEDTIIQTYDPLLLEDVINGKNLCMNPSFEDAAGINWPYWWRPEPHSNNFHGFMMDTTSNSHIFLDATPANVQDGSYSVKIDCAVIEEFLTKPTANGENDIRLQNGSTYVISFYAKASSSLSLDIEIPSTSITDTGTGTGSGTTSTQTIGTTMSRFYFTVQASGTQTEVRFQMPSETKDLWIDAVMFERSNGTTPSTFSNDYRTVTKL